MFLFVGLFLFVCFWFVFGVFFLVPCGGGCVGGVAWRGVRVVFCCGVVVLLSNYLPDEIVCSCARVFCCGVYGGC